LTRLYLFSPIPYSFLHQRPQKLADQFAARGIPVTFIEPCGLMEHFQGRRKGLVRLVLFSVLFHCLGLLSFLVPALGATPRRKDRGTPGPEGMRIVQMPIVYPSYRVDWPILERWNASVLRQALRYQVLRTMQEGERSIAIVEHPFWGIVLREGDFTQIAYDCIDEMALFSGHASAERFAGYERALLAMASATFVTAELLEKRLLGLSPPRPVPVRVPNGVDVDWFQSQAKGTPPDLLDVRHPVAGYVGVLHSWFDFALVGELARAMPDVMFVMVGPLDFEYRNAHLRSFPNLRWTGRKEYADMPRYIGTFDVCLIPFVEGMLTGTTNPVKVFEYFALGKPVVSTPMHELHPFAGSGLLRLARGEGEFADAIRSSLAERGDRLAEGRRQVARAHSWRSLTDIMLSRLEGGTS